MLGDLEGPYQAVAVQGPVAGGTKRGEGVRVETRGAA